MAMPPFGCPRTSAERRRPASNTPTCAPITPAALVPTCATVGVHQGTSSAHRVRRWLTPNVPSRLISSGLEGIRVRRTLFAPSGPAARCEHRAPSASSVHRDASRCRCACGAGCPHPRHAHGPGDSTPTPRLARVGPAPTQCLHVDILRPVRPLSHADPTRARLRGHVTSEEAPRWNRAGQPPPSARHRLRPRMPPAASARAGLFFSHSDPEAPRRSLARRRPRAAGVRAGPLRTCLLRRTTVAMLSSQGRVPLSARPTVRTP
jgi:hypothetical protein